MEIRVTTRTQRKISLQKILGEKWFKLSPEQQDFMISVCGIFEVKYSKFERLLLRLHIIKPYTERLKSKLTTK